LTIAGNGILGLPAQGDGNSPLAAELQPPNGLFLDNLDDVIIADVTGGLQGINTGLTTRALYGTTVPGNTIQMLASATAGVVGVASDNAGNLYFNNELQVVKPNPMTVVAGGLDGELYPGYPVPSGDLGDGGPATAAEFGTVTGLCLDASGNLFITDGYALDVRLVAIGSQATVGPVTVQPGNIDTIAGGGFQLPPSAKPRNPSLYPGAFDHSYYTADQIGDGGPATSAFVAPAGCFVDNLGNIFLADAGNDRIRKIDRSTGYISTVAGSQYPGFSGDGLPAGSATSLNFPNAIWGDQAGNLLISDSGNHRIREISGILPVPSASISCQSQSCSLTNDSSSPAVTVVKNVGTAPLIMSTGPTLTDTTDFSVSASTCPHGLPGLAPNASCTVSVTAKGTAPAGSKVASTNLVFYDNAYLSNTNGSSGPTPDPSYMGQWSGYQQQSDVITYTPPGPPTANFSPASLLFTAENAPLAVKVQNTSSAVLMVSSVTLPAAFAFETSPPSDSCSSAGAAFYLPPPSSTNKGYCSVYIVFTGGMAVNSAVVTISDNTTAGTMSIPVLGYALVPMGPTSFTIHNSAPAPVMATFSLAGIPSSASVTPDCSVTPAGLDVNCTYSSSNRTITATASIPSCVQTSKANSPAHGEGSRYISLGVVGLALLLPWRRSRRKRLLALMTVALLSYVVCGLSACGSTKSISSSCVASVPNGTTFNLNVTANPTETSGQYPSLTLTTPDVISVAQ
jgi:hypothetical protein